MSELFQYLWWFVSRLIENFIHPGRTSYSAYTIPNLIINNPILLLMFTVTVIYSIIRIFNKIRRVM